MGTLPVCYTQKNKIMKKLLTTMLVLLSVVALAQTPKALRVKTYKDGKVINTKLYNIIQPINVTQIKYVPKRIIKRKIVRVPVVKIEYKLVEVPTKPTALDTVSILQAYYPKNAFKDVLVLPEKQGKVTITDTISHNRLASRSWVADITPRVVKEVVEVPAPKIREYYLGPEFSTNFRSINNWYSLNLLVKNKSNHIIKIGGGVNMRDGIDGPRPWMAAGFFFKIK
jgi:hypothetical protein